MKQSRWHYLLLILFTTSLTYAQSPPLKDGKIQFSLNESGNNYVRLTFLNQVWVRYTETNPASTLYGEPVGNVFDIGLRRTRLQLFGQLTDKVFFYTQFGQNNFSYLSRKFTGAFFHDAIVEYTVSKRTLSIGTGLTGWSGLSRYASPSIGSIMPLDVPLYQQATNSISDQFVRKLSVYAKGKISKLDYRLALTKPMSIQQSTVPINAGSTTADFNPYPPKMQGQAYMMLQLLEEESNTTPYTPGTYLGTKKIFNLGAGIIYQPEATWHLNGAGDTLSHHLLLLGFDVFIDAPLNQSTGTAITTYLSAHRFDYGPNYIRHIGVMNPANGTDANGTFSGPGNSFPAIGTGNVIYGQLGYLFAKDLLPNNGTLQPFIAGQLANYEALVDPMLMFEGGINWFIHGSHGAKVSLGYQNRPVFNADLTGNLITTQRKGMWVMQYQISI